MVVEIRGDLIQGLSLREVNLARWLALLSTSLTNNVLFFHKIFFLHFS